MRYDQTLDKATNRLVLTAPALVGGNRRSWTRRLRIDFADADALVDTFAEIRFLDIDNVEHVNRWPRRTSIPDCDR